MIKLKHEDYSIEIFKSPREWAETFYDVPENVVLDDDVLIEINGEINGFACLEDKTIHLYIPKIDDDLELELTIAHEVGHIIEGGFKKSPLNKPRYNKKHEVKANHYENYYKLVKDIYKLVSENLK